MTEATKGNGAQGAGFALAFDLDRPDTFTLTGRDKAFLESDDENVQACYAGKDFAVVVKRISPRRADQIRKAHTKTKVKKGVAIPEIDNVGFVEDMFVECVAGWKGIGGKNGSAMTCNAETKRRLAQAAWNFANVVVTAAIMDGDAVAESEAAEVERFREPV